MTSIPYVVDGLVHLHQIEFGEWCGTTTVWYDHSMWMEVDYYIGDWDVEVPIWLQNHMVMRIDFYPKVWS